MTFDFSHDFRLEGARAAKHVRIRTDTGTSLVKSYRISTMRSMEKAALRGPQGARNGLGKGSPPQPKAETIPRHVRADALNWLALDSDTLGLTAIPPDGWLDAVRAGGLPMGVSDLIANL